MVINMKAIVRRIVDGDTLILDIYLGLLVMVPPTPVIEGLTTAAKPLAKLPMDLYIDPQGMLVMGKVRARLYKFYAAEMGTPEGIEARDRLVAALPIGTEVQVELHGKDKYGRVLIVPMVGTTNICLSLGGGVPQGRGAPTMPVHPGTAAIPPLH